MALRRLARRAASFPPSPFHSPDPCGHHHHHLIRVVVAFSSTAPPHFMVGYLVSRCGLSPAAAAEAAPRLAHISSPAKPEAALAFFLSRGLSRAQVRAVVSRVPSLLLSDVSATLSPKFDAVRAAGLTRADAARLFALYPSALTYGVHGTLLPRLLFWLDLLGSTRLLMKWLAKAWLLKYGVPLLLQNLSTLRGHGVPDGRAAAAVRTQPTLITQSPARLRALLDRADACGVAPGSGMYTWALYALRNVSERALAAKKAAVMRAVGCDEDGYAAMFRRAPCFVFASAELLRRKAEFLVATVGCSPEYIVRNPVMLTLSLDKRMVPRCRAIDALRSKGVDFGKKMSLVGIVRMPEDKFVRKYILKYKEELSEFPELLGLYQHGEDA